MSPTTLTGPIPEASPVDFDRYGDYGGWTKPRPAGDDQAKPRPPATPTPAAATEATAEAKGSAKDKSGAFVRADYTFRGRINPEGPFPPAPDRYVLYISWACPWAHRQAIVRELKGLQHVIGLAVVDPIRDGRGWAFRLGDGLTGDPYNHFTLLRDAYIATDPAYPGHVSVPVLWDTLTDQIVSNNFPDISLDLGSQFNAWATHPGLDLYPTAERAEIDALNDLVYRTVNNGVYRSGFARTQGAYDAAVTDLFDSLDGLEARLADRTYLVGEHLTEADVRLWVTLARFDVVYVTHFKTNLRRLVDYPHLWDYARFLYQQPAFRNTTRFDHIKRHYFITHPHLNPARIVPIGPILDWEAPTERA
jgi:putative glutathione S-transferase